MEAPKLPSIFRQKRAKNFEYQPLYYNETKERLEELKKKYATQTSRAEAEAFRTRLQADWKKNRAKQAGSSNIRLLAIIVVLVLLTYLIIRS